MNIRRYLVPLIITITVLLLFSSTVLSWGFWAHKEINRYAVQALPVEMQPFFKHFADSIIAHAIDPDVRRSSDPSEASTHFIDIDRYGKYPFSDLPRPFDEASRKFGKATIDSNGTVPWRIVEFKQKLTDAMKLRDTTQILFYSSNLGHYVADAHVPLHATENYDGQLSAQKGLHARWESRIPEKFGSAFKLGAPSVQYIKDPLNTAFDIVLESAMLVDSVLALDLEVRHEIPRSELTHVVQRRGRDELEYSDKYFALYQKKLNDMVERRLKDAIRRVASFWYTAWVDAGKPKL
jgi:hypothetical protein